MYVKYSSTNKVYKFYSKKNESDETLKLILG